MHIRRLTPADAASFQQLRLAGLHEAPIAFGASVAEQLALSLDEIGARITPYADRGVYVAPKARALLQAGIDFAQSVPRLLQLNLVVYVENAGAIKLYESLGFEIFGRELGAIMVDDVLYDDFHMRLDLRR